MLLHEYTCSERSRRRDFVALLNQGNEDVIKKEKGVATMRNCRGDKKADTKGVGKIASGRLHRGYWTIWLVGPALVSMVWSGVVMR